MATLDIVLADTEPETEWVRGRALQKVSSRRTHALLQGALLTERPSRRRRRQNCYISCGRHFASHRGRPSLAVGRTSRPPWRSAPARRRHAPARGASQIQTTATTVL